MQCFNSAMHSSCPSASFALQHYKGFATLVDNVPAHEMGKMYGVATVAIAAGTSGGSPS
jgi:hypothetical protein